MRLRPGERTSLALDREAERLLEVCQRIGKRLVHVANLTPKDRLPDIAFGETFKYYGKVVTALLAERRAQVLAQRGAGSPIGDLEVEAELEHLVAKRLGEMTPEERRKLLEQARSADGATVDANGRLIIAARSEAQ